MERRDIEDRTKVRQQGNDSPQCGHCLLDIWKVYPPATRLYADTPVHPEDWVIKFLNFLGLLTTMIEEQTMIADELSKK
jgi:hypothetical protein